MKGISLIKIKFKGYALEFKKKMILQDENKERIKEQQKSKHKANRLKNKLKTIFSAFAFIDLF
ncbi:hypothetical protein HpBHB4_07930 [Helicobacter pylori]